MEIDIVKYLNAGRLFNILKVLSSFAFTRLLNKPVVWGQPVSFSIEPTNYCNLRCPECPSGLGTLTRPLGFLDLSNFKKFVDQVYKESFYIQLYFQGEPFLNKDLAGMIRYAQQKNMFVSVSTNGHFISEKNINEVMNNAPDKIIFSLDGLDEKSYQSYRVGGSFKKAEDALKLLIRAKRNGKISRTPGRKNPFIELQFLVMKQNEHLVNDVIDYGKRLGADKVTLKTMQISSYENLLNFLPEKEKYGRYVTEGKGYRIKNKLYNHCFLLWKSSVITWDGEVVPCCFDKDARYRFGNVFESEFQEIWKSEGYSEFRRKILNGRKKMDICSNCTSGLKMNISSVEY